MKKILLIEDDITMTSLLKTLLELDGFTVATWELSQDPLVRIKEEQPDAVLLDVNLKQHNGLDIIKQLRADDAIPSDLTVIMSSGMNYQDECLACGANHFLLKPYMPDDLSALLS